MKHLQEETEAAAAKVQDTSAPRQLVTSDGTYATQSAFNLPVAAPAGAAGAGLWAALGAGESFTAACACSALCKLALKLPPPRAHAAAHAAARLMAHHKLHGNTPTVL